MSFPFFACRCISAPAADRPGPPWNSGRTAVPPCRGWAPPPGARCGDHGIVHLGAEMGLELVETCWARVFRGSNITRTTPSMTSLGFRRALIFLMVLTRSARPSMAKYSHCMGISTASAAVRALTVSRLRAGGQSMRTKSYSSRAPAKRLLEPEFPLLAVHQFDLGASQVPIGRQHVEPRLVRAQADRRQGGDLQQQMVGGLLQALLVHSAAGGGIALRVQVDQQDTLPQAGQTGGQIHGRGGLAHAPLLVGDGQDSCSWACLLPG